MYVNNTSRDHEILSLASFAVLVQMSMLYVFPAAFKASLPWKNGDAIKLVLTNYAFAQNSFVTNILLSNVLYMKGLTYITPIVEHSAPIMLLFVPFRLLGVVIFSCFHTGLAMTMRLGLFPFVSITKFTSFNFPEMTMSNLVYIVLFLLSSWPPFEGVHYWMGYINTKRFLGFSWLGRRWE